MSAESPMAEAGNFVYQVMVCLFIFMDEKLGKGEWKGK